MSAQLLSHAETGKIQGFLAPPSLTTLFDLFQKGPVCCPYQGYDHKPVTDPQNCYGRSIYHWAGVKPALQGFWKRCQNDGSCSIEGGLSGHAQRQRLSTSTSDCFTAKRPTCTQIAWHTQRTRPNGMSVFLYNPSTERKAARRIVYCSIHSDPTLQKTNPLVPLIRLTLNQMTSKPFNIYLKSITGFIKICGTDHLLLWDAEAQAKRIICEVYFLRNIMIIMLRFARHVFWVTLRK